MQTTIHIPALETERLMIRPFKMTDLDDARRILDVDQNWLEWTVRNTVELAKMHQPPYGDRAIVLKDTGLLIGAVGLVACFAPFGLLTGDTSMLNTPEIGLFWSLDTAHRGKGYATEAAQALIDFAFNKMNLKRIVATTEYENEPSQKVMERLAMKLERNPHPEPFWFQVVGILDNPKLIEIQKQKENHSVS
jgi:[ribosomal protein S5]-alanine N-acetyltransferase